MADISEAARETARAINLEFDCTRYVDCAIDGIAEHVQKAIDQALASQAAEVERLRRALHDTHFVLNGLAERISDPTNIIERSLGEGYKHAASIVRDAIKTTSTPTEAR